MRKDELGGDPLRSDGGLLSHGTGTGRGHSGSDAPGSVRCNLYNRRLVNSTWWIFCWWIKPAPVSLLTMEFLFWFTKPDNISIAHYILLCGQTHGIFKSWQLQFSGAPNAFPRSTNLVFTLWKVKQYSAKFSLTWRERGRCKTPIFVVTYFVVT